MNPIILVAETGSDITPELAAPVPAEVHRKILSRSSMPFIRKTLRLRFSIWLILP